jgi:hypothetical protein
VAVEGGGLELGSDAAAPDIGVEVERVEVAEGGVCAVVGDERRPGRGEADDGVSAGRDDDATDGDDAWVPKEPGRASSLIRRAEDKGFEPLRGCPQHAFQACALGH